MGHAHRSSFILWILAFLLCGPLSSSTTSGVDVPSGSVCTGKALPDVAVDLQRLDKHTWRLYVANRGTASDTKVWLWSQTVDGITNKYLVWEGHLQSDEGKTLRADYRPNGLRLWACVENSAGSRSFATFDVQAKASVDRGRLVQDPRTQRQVWQYRGQMDGGEPR